MLIFLAREKDFEEKTVNVTAKGILLKNVIPVAMVKIQVRVCLVSSLFC